LLFAVATIITFLSLRTPAPEIPMPNNFAKLEPQFRDYLSHNLERTRAAPRNAGLHSRLGLIYAVNGLWPEAHRAFQNAVVLDGEEPLAQMYVGVSAQEMGDFKEAVRIFQNLTARFPNFAPGFYRLGYALLRVGDVEEAEKAYRRLTVLAPEEWRGYAGLGEALIRKNQHAAAVPLLEKAQQLDFSAKTAHHLLGKAYQSLGLREEGELEIQLGRNAVDSPMPDVWAKMASLHTKTLQGQAQLANEYSEEGEPGKAVEILAQASAYHPENIGLMNQLAIALNRAGQPQHAQAILKRALEKDGRHVPAWITLSFCQQMLDQNEAALTTAENAIALAPNIAQAHVAKANALLALERDDDALKALEAAARLDPQNAEIPMEMGDILWRNLHRPLEAKLRYEAARQLDPVLLPLYVRLADLHLQLGELNEGRACIDRLRRLSRNLPDLVILEQRLRKQDAR
jgi:tetratricopeptide (TPR) repeat protein